MSQLQSFQRIVQSYIDSADLAAMPQPITDDGAKLVRLDRKRNYCRARIVKAAPKVAAILAERGMDAADVFRLASYADRGGGGAKYVKPIWPDVRAQLLKAASVAPRAKSSADPISVAIAMKAKNQHMKDKEIAQSIGINPSVLARSVIYKQARNRMKQMSKGELRRGSKSKDGVIEAEDE